MSWQSCIEGKERNRKFMLLQELFSISMEGVSDGMSGHGYEARRVKIVLHRRRHGCDGLLQRNPESQ